MSLLEIRDICPEIAAGLSVKKTSHLNRIDITQEARCQVDLRLSGDGAINAALVSHSLCKLRSATSYAFSIPKRLIYAFR